jgi:ATP-dependent RNA helicase DeaD
MLAGRDVLGQAATGTGKTAAFALPLLHRVTPDAEPRERTTALILVPTRELAMQVAEAVHRYGKSLGVCALPIYGGAAMESQLRMLKRGVDVVVATPGRALDHIRRRTLRLDAVKVVVLDEADEMLDMGFAEDLESLFDATPSSRQTVLFSATMPPRIEQMVRSRLRDPERVTIDRAPAAEGGPLVRQSAYVVARAHKPAALGRVLDVESPTAAIVFCRTRAEVDQLSETLNGRGYRAEALHGGMTQDQRDRVMARLRNEVSDLIVATDVAARGLDIEQLTHVVNYDVPSDPDAYTHRIGRVGRAGREGVAITLAEPREHRMLKTIERVTRSKITVEKLPTVADLRARRLEMTRSAVEELLVEADLERYRVVLDSLADEHDVVEIALAAIKLAHEASGQPDDDEAEIPEVREPRAKTPNARAARRSMTRIFIGAGRTAGVRPKDLVGAIAGESGVSGQAIGAIEVSDRFAIVEVPDEHAQEIIGALRATTIKGKKVAVRRDRTAPKRQRR